jgi:hypothetical protein
MNSNILDELGKMYLNEISQNAGNFKETNAKLSNRFLQTAVPIFAPFVCNALKNKHYTNALLAVRIPLRILMEAGIVIEYSYLEEPDDKRSVKKEYVVPFSVDILQRLAVHLGLSYLLLYRNIKDCYAYEKGYEGFS